MKKIIIIILIIAAIAVGYWLASPLFINKKVGEKIEDITVNIPTEQIVIAEGNFTDADNFHKGEGTVKIIKAGDKYFVRFEDNFKTTNGPDLFVHFDKDGAYANEAKISELKGNIGSQNYEVPANINPADYNEVWIWCRAFSVPFAKAVLIFK